MKVVETIAAVLGLAAFVQGHMEMKSPPPFKSKYNPNAAGDIDYSMTNPLQASGADFPCKGYHSLLGTPKGASVATWVAGGTYQFSLTGSANHNGGSCQASLSYDRGKTWKVVKTWIGGCPPAGDSSWSLTLPNDTPAGEAMFAWTWFNQVGNREMYMNCAAITIKARQKRAATDPFQSRPNMFVANVGNGICTYEGKDVEIPQPGPDVVRNSSKGTVAPGTGQCGWAGLTSNTPGEDQPSKTTPGGVFITNTPSVAPAPTNPAGNGSPSPATTAPASPSAHPTTTPSQQPTPSSAPAPPPSNGGGDSNNPGSGSTAAGSPCSTEGQWNCATNGTQFQRCASGSWSALMPVAAGTSCKPGKSDTLVITKRTDGAGTVRRRHAAGHARLHGRQFSPSDS